MHPYDNLRRLGTWASRFLDTVGDGTGSVEANIDASVTPVVFKYTVPTGHILLINRLIVHIQDTARMDAAKYGNNITITNGIIRVNIDDEGNETPSSSAQRPVRTNGDWAHFDRGAQHFEFGAGDEMFVFEYDYLKDGAPIMVPEGHSYGIKLQDDFTGLVDHTFRVGAVLCKVDN